MVNEEYSALIARKLAMSIPSGLAEIPELPNGLFPHAEALTKWALRRGRCAIFADTGLTKTRMEIAYAFALNQALGLDSMILAPLAVAAQTVEEGRRIGVDVNLCRTDSDVRPGINITNYDRLHKFDPQRFGAVVLDESSCIKHYDSKTLLQLMEAFGATPFRLCATATPAPNDWTELGTHAEFLGICKRVEMLAEYFVHDGGETQVWRLKGHARKAFWRWVASWGAMVRSPADLGFDARAFKLPALEVHEHLVEVTQNLNGQLFAVEAQTLSERRDARRTSLDQRVAECAAIVNADDKEPWIVWCDLNREGDALTDAIQGAIQVAGADEIDLKEEKLRAFATGKARVLVTKPSIAGWGSNWQHCARMAFVGVTDSFEAYYQAVRRAWRFGQKRAVQVHIFASEAEGAVVANLKRKEADAKLMSESLSSETRESVMSEVLGTIRETNSYNADQAVKAPSWLTSEVA